MIEPMIEGVESIALPCTWILAIPAMAVTVFGRRRPVVVTSSFFAVATLVAWVRFAGWWFAAPQGVTQIALGLIVIASTGVAWKADAASSDIVASSVLALAGAWTWIPCVGPHLGEIINGSRRAPLQHLGDTVAFFSGLLLPMILIAALCVLFPNLRDACTHPTVIVAGACLMGCLLYTSPSPRDKRQSRMPSSA